jgi:hypothetical protein
MCKVLYLLCALLLLLALPPCAQSATYTVSQEHGDDAAACGSAPKRTVNAGISCLQPGDTLEIQAGTYAEQIADVDDREHPGTRRPPNGLSWEQATIIRAAPGARVTLTFPPQGLAHLVFLGRSDSAYLQIGPGLTLDCQSKSSNCVWLGPGSHQRLLGSTIHHSRQSCVFTAREGPSGQRTGGDDLQVIANTIHDCWQALYETPPDTSGGGGHGIYCTGKGGRYAYNRVTAANGYGIHCSAEQGGVEDNVIEHNVVTGPGRWCLRLAGTGNSARHNACHQMTAGIVTGGSSAQVEHNLVKGFTPSNPLLQALDTYGIHGKTAGTILSNTLLELPAASRYLVVEAGGVTVEGNQCDVTAPFCTPYTPPDPPDPPDPTPPPLPELARCAFTRNGQTLAQWLCESDTQRRRR